MSMDNLSIADIAAATRDNDGFGGGNGAWVLILLFAMIFGWNGGGFGNGNGAAAATANDLQRAVDLNSIQEGQAGIAADVQRGIYEINGATKDAAYNNLSEIRDIQAAVAAGNANIINNLTAMQAAQQNCCCETKQVILENRYLDAQNAAAIQANDTANTQKILDALAANKIETLQAQVNQLQMQAAMCGVVRYPMATTYTSGGNPFCNCGNGCGNI